jgi:GNAT superfamily N-acetyltransferase
MYFRSAYQDEFILVLHFLKNSAIWLQERKIDYWQGWLDPSAEFVNWIKDGFENNEFYLIYQENEAIGCFRLQWADELFWGQRCEAAGYVHSFTVERRLAGQHIGKRALSLIESYCRQQGKDYLRLDCGKNVVRLCRYYEACGFRNVGETMIQGESMTLYEKKIR